jgi:hypothetical protein
MKHLTLLAVLAGVLNVVACEPAPGDVVNCQKEWSCELAGVVSDDTDTFCTRPDDEDRDADIAAYQTEFAETCDSVNVDCGNGEFATCVATCTTGGGECDIATAVRVRL